LPVIVAALRGDTNAQIKQLSDDIINAPKVWPILKKHKINIPQGFDHIDIMPIPIGQASLKIYGGRLHAPKLQDLPIEPSALITPFHRKTLRLYCHNDLASHAHFVRRTKASNRLTRTDEQTVRPRLTL
jgi:hypothetical protein